MTENNNRIEKANDVYFDIYQKSVVDVRKWQLVSGGLGIFVLLCLAAVVILAKINKPIPYIITVNKLGKAKVIKYSVNKYPVSRAAKEYFIGRWIHWTFDINRHILKKELLKSYAYTTNTGQNYLNQYINGASTDPFTWVSVHHGSVYYDIISMNFINSDVISIHTKKITRGGSGNIKKTRYVDFIAHIQIIPPTSTLLIYKNPLGVYINSFTINKAVGGVNG
jgi:type IV secretory pathway TrbF-like protein